MPPQTLYKYRSLTNWAPILDIIANERLYAAPFERLNDPMEGRYYYFGDAVSAGFRKAIYKSKVKLKICSLSAARSNTLLWSYYANGHTGVAFAVKVKKRRGSSLEVRPVTYDSWVSIGAQELRQQPDKLALRILTQKQQPWAHEEEVRIFSRDTYVPITLTEILLGCNISDEDRELLTIIARKWHPKIKITKVRRSWLDEPDAISARASET